MFAFEKTLERGTTAIISPGMRYAFKLRNDEQLVIGAATPVGLTSDSPIGDYFSTVHSSIHLYGNLAK